MRSLFFALLTLAVGAAPALATGSLSCSFRDSNLGLVAEATFSRGVGEGVMSFGAKLEILAKAAIPDDLRKVEFDLSHLTQRWLYGGDVRLRMYREREGSAPHGYVELVVETKRTPRDETEYRGSYVLTVYDVPTTQGAEPETVMLRGRAACSVG